MSATTSTKPDLNGVETGKLLATVSAVKAQPELAAFQFRARNEWVSGTHNRSTIRGFHGAGGEDTTREREFVFDADHPAVLVGTGQGPTPVEFLLHGIAACLTAGLANIAAARGVRLREVRSSVTGDIDLRGLLGLDDEVRNGYQRIAVTFTIKGDADEETLRGLIERSVARSAVYDVLTNGVPVDVLIDAHDTTQE